MKIQSRTITVEIDIEEWKKCQKEWEALIYGEKKAKVGYADTPNLYDLITSIQSVATNPAHKIDRKINTY